MALQDSKLMSKVLTQSYVEQSQSFYQKNTDLKLRIGVFKLSMKSGGVFIGAV